MAIRCHAGQRGPEEHAVPSFSLPGLNVGLTCIILNPTLVGVCLNTVTLNIFTMKVNVYED